MTPAQQAQAFGWMALCGGALGACYDALGLLRHGGALCGAADLLFGLLAAAGVIGTALQLECEAFRLYTLLGAAAGFAAYQLSLGTIVRFLTERMRTLSKKVSN